MHFGFFQKPINTFLMTKKEEKLYCPSKFDFRKSLECIFSLSKKPPKNTIIRFFWRWWYYDDNKFIQKKIINYTLQQWVQSFSWTCPARSFQWRWRKMNKLFLAEIKKQNHKCKSSKDDIAKFYISLSINLQIELARNKKKNILCVKKKIEATQKTIYK